MKKHNLDNHWQTYKPNLRNNDQLISKLVLRELDHWPNPYKVQNRWKHSHSNVEIKVLTNINLFQNTSPWHRNFDKHSFVNLELSKSKIFKRKIKRILNLIQTTIKINQYKNLMDTYQMLLEIHKSPNHGGHTSLYFV
jgi:hypothetical protein